MQRMEKLFLRAFIWYHESPGWDHTSMMDRGSFPKVGITIWRFPSLPYSGHSDVAAVNHVAAE